MRRAPVGWIERIWFYRRLRRPCPAYDWLRGENEPHVGAGATPNELSAAERAFGSGVTDELG